MKGSSRRRLVVVGLVAMLAAGCTSWSGSNTSAPDGGTIGDTVCFLPLDEAQRKKLQEAAPQPQPAVVPAPATPPSAPQSICVLEEVDDEYQEHYYTEASAKEGGFTGYQLYATLVPQRTSLMSYSLLPGPLTQTEVVAMETFICVASNGIAYKPYVKNGDGSWARQRETTPMTVTKVLYSMAPPVNRADAYAKPFPAGYSNSTLLAANKGVFQRGVVSTSSIPTVAIVSVPPSASTSSAEEEESSTGGRRDIPPSGVKSCAGSTKPYGTFPNCRVKP